MMATKKIFWEDPYLTQLDAKVSSINENIVTLNQTILYAFSGGQESDQGTIEEYTVLEANKVGKEIYYTLNDNHTLKENQSVKVVLDWERRYRLMRLHFAAELILELVYQNYDHPEKIGAHISAEKARVDFYWDGNISSIFPNLMSKLNEIIAADYPILSEFEEYENERRTWEIVGFAKVSCGGTHLKSTSEVGSILLKRVNIGGGKEKIEITLQ